MEVAPFFVTDDNGLVPLLECYPGARQTTAGPREKRPAYLKKRRPKLTRTMRRKYRLLEIHGATCPYCDTDLLRDVQTMISATIDHIKPQYFGGAKREAENQRVVCAACNSLKGAFPAADLNEARQLVRMRLGEFKGIRRDLIARRIVRSFWRRLWARLTGAHV